MRLLDHHWRTVKFPILAPNLVLKITPDPNFFDFWISTSDILTGIDCIIRQKQLKLHAPIVDNSAEILIHEFPPELLNRNFRIKVRTY
jgi:hypothetical protein